MLKNPFWGLLNKAYALCILKNSDQSTLQQLYRIHSAFLNCCMKTVECLKKAHSLAKQIKF